ncbi:MAG: iron-containing alcohol dehydrogenase [Alphaproteobacteria bacterium]|nr:iron-containing alcohol dehydrogenase [Alphaproteobacteria bacterium]
MALITYLTRIQFDHGALALLAGELAALGLRRPLVVTDRGLVASGLVERLHAALPARGAAAVYDGTPENPTERAVWQALERYQAAACDGVIGFGGGSSMDLGKAVALLATHAPPLTQYMMAEGGVRRITAAVAPVVAIPTTAGTGSEVGRGAVIVLDDGRKLALISPHLIPRLAICDPSLTLGLPPRLSAATGLDALAHCIEAFLSPAINPPAEAIALDGAARISRHLERAVANGADAEARWNMMMAAMEGAMAFQKGLGAVHALSHPLGTLGLHHGTLNAVLLPAVLRFNAGHVGDKYTVLASRLGLRPGAALPEWIATLNARVGLPPSLGAMGVHDAVIPRIAAAALKDHCHATNPRPATAADYQRMLEESF